MKVFSRKPKLVQIVTSPLTAWSFLNGQLRYMREHGFDVTLITNPGPELDKIGQREGVRTIGLPMRREPSPLRDLISLTRLVTLLRKLRPDIVHFGTPKASFIGGLASKLAGVPIRLMTLHGMRADGLKQPTRTAVLTMERISCMTAHRVYCVSRSLRWRALELQLTSAEKLRVLGQGTANGIDATRFSRGEEISERAHALRKRHHIPAGSPVVGFVGRLVRDKGISELVSAFKQLKTKFTNLVLLLVGPFEDYDKISAELRTNIDNDPQIVHIDFLEDPVPAYALMNVLALPSYREGFPYVPMEAAAMQLPVVATRVTGCVDAIIDGCTGTLIAPQCADELADALGRYLADPQLCHRHGVAGRERIVNEFEPETIWRGLREEYVELLLGSQSPQLANSIRNTFAGPISTNLHFNESPVD